MAKKKFDRDEVLDKAITLFWQYGYVASGMKQITEATGLNPGSIYHEFENKEGLFQAALDRYAERSVENIHSIMKQSDDIKEGLRNLLDSFIEQSRQPDYCGCFIIKTQLELSAQNSALYPMAVGKLQKIEKTLSAYLSKTYTQEQANSYASNLMMIIFGIRVYGYQVGCHLPQDSQQSLHHMIEKNVMMTLPWLYEC